MDILATIPPLEGFTHIFHSEPLRQSVSGLSVIISSHLPAPFHSQAKYVLCSRTPHLLTRDVLSRLYDLWPLPLTPSLIRFCFGKLQHRLKAELATDTEHDEHQKRILEMARQDYLTGLATRWYLQDFIERNRHERNITCIYFDLDNFKKVNDTFGHQAGDRALAATAEMMQREFYPIDGFCARMGGDEFMVVLLGKRDILDTERRVSGFIRKLMQYYSASRTMQALSVSAGISQTMPGQEKTIDRIIHEADRALYEAKRAGKAQCKIYFPLMG